VNLLPAKIDELADPQCMPEGHQDQQPIAAGIAALASGGHQLVDLWFGQVFALPIFGVLCPTTVLATVVKPMARVDVSDSPDDRRERDPACAVGKRHGVAPAPAPSTLGKRTRGPGGSLGQLEYPRS